MPGYYGLQRGRGRGRWKGMFGRGRGSAAMARASSARAARRAIARVAKEVVYRERETKTKCRTATGTLTLAATWKDVNSLVMSNVGFTGVATGDDVGSRDGDIIQAMGVNVRLACTTASDRPQAVRLVVLEQLADYTSADLPATFIGCFPPGKKDKLYRVRYDRIWNPAPRLDDASSLGRGFFPKIYVKLNKRLKFDGAGSGDLDVGKLTLWAITDNLAGGTDFVDITDVESTFTFKDV